MEGVAFQKEQDAPKQSPRCLCMCREDVQVDPAETSSETSVPVQPFLPSSLRKQHLPLEGLVKSSNENENHYSHAITA